MKKPLIISIIVAAVIVSSLSLLYIDDNSGNEIINQLKRDDIKALAMLTVDNEWGNQHSSSITESFLINGEQAPKIEIRYEPENPNYADIRYNLSTAINEHLKTYTSDEIAIVVIGFDEKKILDNLPIDDDKLSSIHWLWI